MVSYIDKVNSQYLAQNQDPNSETYSLDPSASVESNLNYENREFLNRKEELTLIKELQGLYGHLLTRITEAPAAIDAMAHLCNCVISHELSPSSLFDRGERTAAKLKEQIVEATISSRKLADERKLLELSSSELSNQKEPSHEKVFMLEKAQFDNRYQANQLIRELRPTNAAVDYLAPYLIKVTENRAESIYAEIRNTYEKILGLRDHFFASYEKFAISEVRRRFPQVANGLDGGWSFDDLTQVAQTAIFTALHRFNPEMGTRFTTFASQWIGAAIYEESYDKFNLIRIPQMVQKEVLGILKRGDNLRTADEFDATFNLSLELLTQAQSAMSVSSLNRDIGESKDCLWVETLSSFSEGDDPVHQCHIRDLAKIKHEALSKISEILSPREMTIIKARFGLGGETPAKLVDLARSLGISSTRVDQLQKSAMEKLRLALEEKKDLLLSS